MPSPSPDQTVAKQNNNSGRSLIALLLLALIGWLSYRYTAGKSNKKTTQGKPAPKGITPVKPSAPDALENTMSGDDARTVQSAAAKYDKNYQERMKQMVAPKAEERAAPFIGFSLTDNIVEGSLIVDGVFDDGPAYQVGIDIDHELVGIEGEKVTSITEVRELIQKHCRPGYISQFNMKDSDGKAYDAQLWIMTADDKYQGKPYYFNRVAHKARQSDRLKQTWKPEEVKANQ